MTTPLNILLATDGSDNGLAVTDYLMGMPLPEGSRVTVMTVLKEVLHEPQLSALTDDKRKAYQEVLNNAITEAQALLDTEAERLRSCGLGVDTLIRSGHAAEQIVDVANQTGCQLIAIGSHGTHAPDTFLLGGVTDRVLEYAPCSVLIVRPASDQAVSDEQLRILVAYDDTPPARFAVELCAGLPFPPETHLKVITVLPLIHMFRQDVRQQLSWVWQEKKNAARKALDRVAGEIDWRQVDVSADLIEDSDVSRAILEQAAAFDSDLLIIGHKGKHRFERFLLGSVTAHVAHHAPCSVLCVRTTA